MPFLCRNYIKFNFSVGYALDIDEKDEIGNISIFPNPNSGIFYVDFKGDLADNIQLEIFDLMGRRIISKKMDVKSNFSTSLIDLSNSPNGHYIVKVITYNGVFIEELIKQ